MSDALYERYKDALRRGHVAAQRGRSEAALEAYGEAARLAPDRALPLIGIGAVLARQNKPSEALAAYDAALERAPANETALGARADILAARGHRAGAAAALDRLVVVHEAAGRLADALEAAARSLELAESRSRRVGLRALVERMAPEGAVDPVVAEALSRAHGLLGEKGAETDSGTTSDEDVEVADEPKAPPFDAIGATAALEAAAARGDAGATRGLALAAAASHRAAGRPHAAIDACYVALATNPADPDLHLMLAELYLDRGWRTAAADKLMLLAHLANLTGDETTRERLCAVVGVSLPDDPRLAAVCA